MTIVGDTFPAGTLSGAPKYKAMELIDRYENQSRGFYGGAVGIIGLDGSVNLAIAIRSFVSKQNKLYYQAGAGIVIRSDEEKELQEVNNKLAALKKASFTSSTVFGFFTIKVMSVKEPSGTGTRIPHPPILPSK